MKKAMSTQLRNALAVEGPHLVFATLWQLHDVSGCVKNKKKTKRSLVLLRLTDPGVCMTTLDLEALGFAYPLHLVWGTDAAPRPDLVATFSLLGLHLAHVLGDDKCAHKPATGQSHDRPQTQQVPPGSLLLAEERLGRTLLEHRCS